MDIYSKLKDKLQNVCHTPTESALILAQVKQVSGQTCDVIINNTLELTDVRLSKSKDIFNYNSTNQTVIISYNIFWG